VNRSDEIETRGTKDIGQPRAGRPESTVNVRYLSIDELADRHLFLCITQRA
jgi:hypothetical protein